MMQQQQQQPAALGGVIGEEAAQQRRLPHVEPETPRIEAFAQLLRNVARRRVERGLLDAQRRRAPHNLHRLGQALPGHRRAQNVVARDHRLQGDQKSLEPLAPVKRQQRRQQIRVAAGGHQMVEQYAFLQRRQRVDVLHVGRPARNPADDAIDVAPG